MDTVLIIRGSLAFFLFVNQFVYLCPHFSLPLFRIFIFLPSFFVFVCLTVLFRRFRYSPHALNFSDLFDDFLDFVSAIEKKGKAGENGFETLRIKGVENGKKRSKGKKKDFSCPVKFLCMLDVSYRESLWGQATSSTVQLIELCYR